jgi:hypothetical protein
MAKIKRTITKLSGKLGDEVHINSGHYAPHVRKAPKKGKKKAGNALKEQNSRTGFMNSLASELNYIIRAYSDNFKSRDFYHRILSRFRKKPSDSRFLELYKLKGLEIHEGYPFNRLGQCKATVSKVKNKTVVSLDVLSHPRDYKLEANCYYYEVLLITWSANNKKSIHELQLSEWMKLKDDEKEFEFIFTRPADATHWLLCLRKRLGSNEEVIGAFPGEGMQVYDVGTFDAAEAALLKKKIAEEKEREQLAKVNGIKQVKDVVRVKARVVARSPQ